MSTKNILRENDNYNEVIIISDDDDDGDEPVSVVYYISWKFNQNTCRY